MKFENPNLPATKNQLWFLHRLSGEDTRTWQLTIQQASDKIDTLLLENNAAKAKNPKTQPVRIESPIKAGDYFSTSWGYDQTNIDYIVVVSVSPTGKTCQCKMVQPINVGYESHEDLLTPGTAYGEPFTMQVRKYGDTYDLRGSYPFCNNANSKRLGTFSKTHLGEIERQTDPMFGH